MAAAGQGVEVQLPDAEQKRQYHYLELPNRLACLLVSDPETEVAAAAMDCAVGWFQDPPDVAGLAHFTEHMMFLGTQKYPKESEYSDYLSDHGGSSNAFTMHENTNFYFNVGASALDGALDRFAQFFIAPLFTESATEREIMAIESEDQKNRTNDYMTFTMFLKEVACENHPFHRFGNGDKDSLLTETAKLGVDLRQRLLDFQKYYSANMMKLCVVGKDSIEQLRGMVEQYFSPIVNKELPRASQEVEALPAVFDRSKLGRLYHVTAVKEDTRIYLGWDIHASYEHWETKPHRYWAHLVGHECTGSILDVLKQRGWADELVAGTIFEFSRKSSLFEVEIYLTEEGHKHLYDVISIVFEYIAIVRRRGFCEEVWAECAATAQMEFKFKEQVTPPSHASMCSSSLNRYPPAQVMSGDYLTPRKDPAATMAVGDELRPELCVFALKRHGFSDCPDVTLDRKTRYYGLEYGSAPIPPELLARWADPPTLTEGLGMPPVNPFIPDDFTLKPLSEGQSEVPELAHCNAMPPHCAPQLAAAPEVEVYHQQDTRFRIPKGYIRFLLISAAAYASPRSRLLHRVYVKLFKDAANEFVYFADVANLNLDTQPSSDGIDILCCGFNQKLPELLRKTFEALAGVTEPSAESFSMWHQKVKQELTNYTRQQSYLHAGELTGAMCHLTRWTANELLEVVDTVTVGDLHNYIRTFLSNVRVCMLACGNITRGEACALPARLREWLLCKCGAMPYSMQPNHPRIVRIPAGINMLVPAKEHNPDSTNSAVEYYVQVGMQSPRTIALVDVYLRLISNSFFTELRTKEQLGYVVFASVKKLELIEGIRFTVQSALVGPWYIYSRIYAFIAALDEYLSALSGKQFEAVVAAEVESREEKPKTLVKQGEKWYKCIESRAMNFNANEEEIEALRALVIDDVRDFHRRFVSNSSPERRAAASLIYGNEYQGEVDAVVQRWSDAGSPVLLRETLQMEKRRCLVSSPTSPKPQHSDPAAEPVGAVEEQGVDPETAEESGIADAAGPAEVVAGQGDLSVGDGGGELPVAWVMSYGRLRQCCETFAAWQLPDGH
eukprot:TRINITY_DN50678_c0_g1_i1.p1 TRINITY_DN50678_c0_g1~~TRINITY_DN50678_c0_g1_i1.p1  ORF type:complete len:1094 (+),score=392.16 TRINITY_DN50678_c0_g1_i1:84-3284(+)